MTRIIQLPNDGPVIDADAIISVDRIYPDDATADTPSKTTRIYMHGLYIDTSLEREAVVNMWINAKPVPDPTATPFPVPAADSAASAE